MASKLLFLLFIMKSKYRRKRRIASTLVVLLIISFSCHVSSKGSRSCRDLRCVHGTCGNGTCLCEKGWQGELCEFCGGKVSLDAPSGLITDGPGNYSFDLHCTWLINSSQPNATIRLTFHHFATECCWDHLYVFDGDSAYAPLLAAYSGVMSSENDLPPKVPVPELVTSTGVAYIHFYSDTLYNMSGFNISYSVEMCPSNCSGRGVCIDGICTCNGHWEGPDCHTPICPNGCGGRGTCDRQAHRCVCDTGYAGEDCTSEKKHGFWDVLRIPEGIAPIGRASHAAVVYMDSMYIFGGERFRKEHYCDIWRFDFNIQSWTPVQPTFSSRSPNRRFGHSAVVHKNYAYIYGGVVFDKNISNELWRYDFEESSWTRLDSEKADACLGHTATVVDNVMIIIFGYSPIYGYLNYVQLYHIESRKWERVQAKGVQVKGGFGHTSVYDIQTKKIYVHGGYYSESSSSYDLDDVLYVYDPVNHHWDEKKRGIAKRYLHSAVIISGLMLVYGGNIHNDTISYHGSKCRSSSFLAYDIACNSWLELNSTTGNDHDYARYGHTAVAHNESVYIFGGFNGEMLNDVLKFTAGSCEDRPQKSCTFPGPGVKCWWNMQTNVCEVMNFNPAVKHHNYKVCPYLGNIDHDCGKYNSCSSCLQANLGCVWCNGICSFKNCEIKQNSERSSHGIYNQISNILYQDHHQGINESKECDRNSVVVCSNLHSCQACTRELGCTWNSHSQCRALSDILHKGSNLISCQPPCSQYTTCQNCTQVHCLWCNTGEGRCIESNAYAPSFSYGQCMDWTTSHGKCPPPKCANINTCSACQETVECGWCDNNSKTGIGTCKAGGNSYPFKFLNGIATPDPESCRKGWYFTSCPSCQCNGHSTCTIQANECDQPCKDNTVGKHCEHCAEGFFGVPINGGNCTPCFCNGHGTLCMPDTGKCFCTTKGIIGNNCEKCEESNKYFGNPADGGTCYYNLAIDYQFTFNLSKPEDYYYTHINFMTTPSKQDMDTDLIMYCSVDASVNVTVRTASKPENPIIDNQPCDNFKYRFPHSEFEFGTDENTTLYVYVYDFETPISVKITFSQSQKLDLLQFFITFSCCFLTLLIVAAILWKIKQKYDFYRRRQQLYVEMEQMASRPFSCIFLDIDSYENSAIKPQQEVQSSNQNSTKNKKEHPSPIALEPCYDNKAAVLSLIMKLPMGDETYIPVGQSGITIASTLVTLGNPRKRSLETPKIDGKGKVRKPVHHPHFDSCI